MPSLAVTCAIATQTLVAEKLNAKIKPSAIFVDNVLAGEDAVLTFNDFYAVSVTNGVPIPPAAAARPRLMVNVAMGTCVSLEDELKDVEFLGLVQLVRGAVSAACRVSFCYNFI